jgi:alpha-beta hydrolase superfamily lysophospholipase
MFNKSSAALIRDSLPELDFRSGAEPAAAIQSYIDFYGLDFSSSRLDIHHSLGTFQSASFTLVAQYFDVPLSSKRGTAFLLHGYFDHAGIYGNLIRHFLEQGIAVVVFDLPGHGLSSGAPASINSFREYSKALCDCLSLAEKQELSHPWILAGQSTGAAIIIDSLLEDNLHKRFKISHHILLAPLLKPRHWRRSSFFFQISRWFISASERNFTDNSHDQEFLRFLRENDVLQPRLLPRDWVLAMMDYMKRFRRARTSDAKLKIIQGSGDGTVAWETNLPELVEKFPASEIHMITDARHHLVNESAELRACVFGLIDEIISDID